MATASDPRSRSPNNPNRAAWRVGLAAALALAAPFACLQAAANADLPAPQWARGWNGFRLAEDARAHLSADPDHPEAGLTLQPNGKALARAAYAREPVASDALFVLALAQGPLREEYRAGPIAREAVALDKRSALLQLLMIADAAGRGDFPALFAHADVLAAVHPRLADSVLQPLFARLGDPAAVPVVADALARQPRWAPAFKRHVPTDEAALLGYAKIRSDVGRGQSWESDEALVAAFADKGRYDEAFDLWRTLEGARADPFGFSADARFAPIAWQVVERGERSAQIAPDGAMTVTVERGAGGELARRLLQLAPGRYRLDVRIAADGGNPPLWLSLGCAKGGANVGRWPLAPRTELSVSDANCPAYWLIVEGSALNSRYGIDATLSDWRFTRVP